MGVQFPGSNEQYDPRRNGRGKSPYATYKRGEAPRGWVPWKGAREIWVDARATITIGSAANELPVSRHQTARQSLSGAGSQSFDVSQDIVGGSINRKRNAPTEMKITIANDGNKYGQLFTPMDRIQLFLRRDDTEYTAFTGYVVRSPYTHLISQEEITLECRCLIWRFIQKQWDPELPENILALASDVASGVTGEDPEAPEPTSEDWVGHITAAQEADPENTELTELLESYNEAVEAEDEEAIASLQDEMEGLIGAPTTAASTALGVKYPDELLAYLLTDERHLGIDPSMIKIQAFPEDWKERAAQLTAEMDYCMTQWLENINCPEGEPVGAAEGDGGCEDEGGSVSGEPGSEDPSDVAAWMAAEAEKQGIPGVLPVMTSIVETGDPNTCQGMNNIKEMLDHDSLGYFQQRPSAGWGTPEQLIDPNYALGKFLEAAQAGKGQYGDDCASLGNWAQAIQGSAHPERYANCCEAAQDLLGGGGTASAPCGSGGSDTGKHGVEEEGDVEAGEDPSREEGESSEDDSEEDS